jgi:hypothetical protein
VRSNWKTDKQKGREENMGVTKREITRTTKGIEKRKTRVWCGIMKQGKPLSLSTALNVVTLQNAGA